MPLPTLLRQLMSFFKSSTLDPKNATRLHVLAGTVLLLTVFGLYGAYYSAKVSSSLGPSIDDQLCLSRRGGRSRNRAASGAACLS